MHDFELDGFPNSLQDTYLSQVEAITHEDGSRSLRKANRFVLDEKHLPMVDFLHELTRNPQPYLLIPESVDITVEQKLVETYPLIDGLTLGNAELSIKRGIQAGKIDEWDVVDIALQLTSALSYIHQLGYVHGDVRAENIFMQVKQDRLETTLFDYNSLTKPHFQVDGIDSWNVEKPPELRVGNVMIDAKFDVYALGYILSHLTHDTYGDERLLSSFNSDHPLFEIIRKAKASLELCYPNATKMHEDLLMLAG